jgi:uncharacterized protein (TIGR00251 family)
MNLADHVLDGKLKVLVKPNAPETKLIGYDDARKAVKIAIAAPPEDNKANKELIRFVSKLLKRPVKIKSGLKSKEKLLLI